MATQVGVVKRCELRGLKLALKAGQKEAASVEDIQRAKESALRLLDRSIISGHRRLAIIRLVEAVKIGANLTRDRWKYCEEVLQDADSDLRDLALTAFAGQSLESPPVASQSARLESLPRDGDAK